jgi:hypothetical protein
MQSPTVEREEREEREKASYTSLKREGEDRA